MPCNLGGLMDLFNSELKKDIQKIKIDVERIKIISDSSELKEEIDIVKSKVNNLEKQLIEVYGMKKTVITIGAIISLLLAFFTYYAEYISSKPDQIGKITVLVSEVQKSLDTAWIYINKLKEKGN